MRPEVHKAMNVKNAAFWEVLSCKQIEVYQHIGVKESVAGSYGDRRAAEK